MGGLDESAGFEASTVSFSRPASDLGRDLACADGTMEDNVVTGHRWP